IVELVRTQVVRRINLIACVGAVPVERERRRAAAALLALGAVPFVREEVFQRGEDEGAKFPLLAAEPFEVIPGEESGEEALRQVFGVLTGVAVPSNVGVKRIPISAAQFLERQIRLPCATAARGEHDRPTRRAEII